MAGVLTRRRRRSPGRRRQTLCSASAAPAWPSCQPERSRRRYGAPGAHPSIEPLALCTILLPCPLRADAARLAGASTPGTAAHTARRETPSSTRRAASASCCSARTRGAPCRVGPPRREVRGDSCSFPRASHKQTPLRPEHRRSAPAAGRRKDLGPLLREACLAARLLHRGPCAPPLLAGRCSAGECAPAGRSGPSGCCGPNRPSSAKTWGRRLQGPAGSALQHGVGRPALSVEGQGRPVCSPVHPRAPAGRPAPAREQGPAHAAARRAAGGGGLLRRRCGRRRERAAAR